MAFIDDRDWVLSHIRHCFITSDESGFCEQVLGKDEEWDRILNDVGRKNRLDHFHSYAYGKGDGAEESPTRSPFRSSSISSSSSIRSTSSDAGILPHSPDIHFDSFSSRPGPSSGPATAASSSPARVDSGAKLKTVSCRHQEAAAKDFDPKSAGDVFDKKPIKSSSSAKMKEGRQVSSLSKLLSAAENMPVDPFFEFVQFDGASNPGAPVKSINVYLVMSEGEERWTPIPVVVQCAAKVSDFIGLICHHYVQSRREPALKNTTPAGYSLFMADDDGMVEEDFPPLDAREPISKFDLNLALVENEVPQEEEAPPTIIKVNFPQRGWGMFQMESDGLLMGDILKIILAKRRIPERRGIKYILEIQADRGWKAIDLDLSLKEIGTLEFRLVRDISNYEDDDPENEEDQQPPQPQMHDFLIPDERRYKVQVARKFKANVEVHLDISADRLEVCSVIPGAVKSLFLLMGSVVDANIIAEKTKGSTQNATFRITYDAGAAGGGDVKHKDFTCVSLVAKEIVERIGELILRFPANRNPVFVRSDRKKASLRQF